jgi:hypothetical protein
MQEAKQKTSKAGMQEAKQKTSKAGMQRRLASLLRKPEAMASVAKTPCCEASKPKACAAKTKQGCCAYLGVYLGVYLVFSI